MVIKYFLKRDRHARAMLALQELHSQHSKKVLNKLMNDEIQFTILFLVFLFFVYMSTVSAQTIQETETIFY